MTNTLNLPCPTWFMNNPNVFSSAELVGQFDDNETRKRPQVRCDNERIARRVTQKINYARNMFDEMTQAVIEGNDNQENEL